MLENFAHFFLDFIEYFLGFTVFSIHYVFNHFQDFIKLNWHQYMVMFFGKMDHAKAVGARKHNVSTLQKFSSGSMQHVVHEKIIFFVVLLTDKQI